MISNKSNSGMIQAVLEEVAKNGISQLKESLETLINQLMIAEREDYIGAAPYERSPDRKYYSNGFKNKTHLTTSGELKLDVPQVRGGDFYPACLEKGERTEQALKLALAEAYVQGVSTRKMEKLTKKLCGKEISSTQVSRFAQVLDEEVQKFKQRSLGKYTYVYLDAIYEKVRYEGIVRSLAVLKAVGVTEEGYREVLDVSCSLSEAEVHWREFIEGLLSRGMKGVELIISDDHKGLRKAIQATMPTVKWQRCIFHLSQNAGSYAPKKDMKAEIFAAVKEIYSAIDRDEAMARMKKIVNQYRDSASKFCDWLEENMIEGLTFFDFPKAHWKKIRTNNILERHNQEQRRRTKAVRLFPSIESCERLVTTVAIRTHEEWATGKRYMKMDK